MGMMIVRHKVRDYGQWRPIFDGWKERMNAKAIIPEKLRMMLTFEGDTSSADYLLDEWPEALLAHAAKPTIPVFVVSAVAAHPQGITGRWSWSEHRVSSEQFSATAHAPYP